MAPSIAPQYDMIPNVNIIIVVLHLNVNLFLPFEHILKDVTFCVFSGWAHHVE